MWMVAGVARRQPSPHLVLNYRRRQPTGWPAVVPGQRVGETVGGHTSTLDFTFNGKSYRIGLLSFGPPHESHDPVYEHVPAHPTIAFEKTLGSAFGACYSFRYRGGFAGRRELNVQSYSVFVTKPTMGSPEIDYGADLYVVYDPDLRRGDPPIQGTLRWIQVVRWRGTGSSSSRESYVDNLGRANPFYMSGGLISINGTRVFNFASAVDVPAVANPADSTVLSEHFMAEVFLARDTQTKDAAGRVVIDILGGIKYGWQLHEVLS
jgi:hypothetical protein